MASHFFIWKLMTGCHLLIDLPTNCAELAYFVIRRPEFWTETYWDDARERASAS